MVKKMIKLTKPPYPHTFFFVHIKTSGKKVPLDICLEWKTYDL
jgi:hypothetical protein